MTNDLIRRGASDLIRETLSHEWSTQRAALSISLDDAEAAMTAARAGSVPLIEADPGLQGEVARSLVNALADIGAKIAPTMDTQAAQRWRVAVMKALSNLPGKVAVQATQRAMHEPLRIERKEGTVYRPAQYTNEVEMLVRQQAEELMIRQRLSLNRLEALISEIERAQNAQPRLEAPAADEPMTNREIRALSAEFRKMALTQGWLTQEQIDAADAEKPE